MLNAKILSLSEQRNLAYFRSQLIKVLEHMRCLYINGLSEILSNLQLYNINFCIVIQMKNSKLAMSLYTVRKRDYEEM